MKLNLKALMARTKNDDKLILAKPNHKLVHYPWPAGDINIAVADGIVSDVIQRKIKKGRYEKHEASTISKLMIEDEILLELGAGVGLISTLAWLSGKVKEVHCFEADPRLIDLIKETHAQNGVIGYVYNQVLSSDQEAISANFIEFHLREHFYGSSTNGKIGNEITETIKVCVSSFQMAVSRIKPTVIACDIEGSELGLFSQVDMPSVKFIMLETHQLVIGGEGMRQIFSNMHDADFHYDERWSKGSVLVFSRIGLAG